MPVNRPANRPASPPGDRPARPVRKARPSVGAALANGVGRGLGALWMGLAHGVGWAARGVGRQAATAKEIDPEHRRDGGGLLLLGLAILVGVAVWAGSAGPVGQWLADATRLFFGGLAVLLPLLLLYGAVRLMRRPADPEHRGRTLVGWTAIIVATAALLHIAQQPADDLAMDKSGGLLGYGVGALLERAVTAWVAVPLLVLLFVFGVLVITATPINRIPERVLLLVDVLLGRSTTRAPLPDLRPGRRTRRGRRGAGRARRRRAAGRARSPTSGSAPRRARSRTTTILHDVVPVPKVPASRKSRCPSRPSTRRCPLGPSSWRSARCRATTGCRRPRCSARARRRSPAAGPTTR